MWPGALPTYPRNFFRHHHILPLLLHQAVRMSSFWLQPASCTILWDKEHWPVNVWIREKSEVAGSNAILNTGNSSIPHPPPLLSRWQQRQITSTSIAFQAFYLTVIIFKKKHVHRVSHLNVFLHYLNFWRIVLDQNKSNISYSAYMNSDSYKYVIHCYIPIYLFIFPYNSKLMFSRVLFAAFSVGQSIVSQVTWRYIESM
jgi:hypothetical protein